MQIDIKPAEEIKVKYGDKEFAVRRPKVGVVREFLKRSKSAEFGSELEIMIEFCAVVGVPEDVINDWDQSMMKSFFRQMSEDEKKT